jgi:hypothetical protein
MYEYKVYTVAVSQVVDIVKDLKEQGLVVSTDFDFSWHPTKWSNDDFTFDEEEAAHCVFTFYSETWANWFALKYL